MGNLLIHDIKIIKQETNKNVNMRKAIDTDCNILIMHKMGYFVSQSHLF